MKLYCILHLHISTICFTCLGIYVHIIIDKTECVPFYPEFSYVDYTHAEIVDCNS